jgi:hypothetical protein
LCPALAIMVVCYALCASYTLRAHCITWVYTYLNYLWTVGSRGSLLQNNSGLGPSVCRRTVQVNGKNAYILNECTGIDSDHKAHRKGHILKFIISCNVQLWHMPYKKNIEGWHQVHIDFFFEEKGCREWTHMRGFYFCEKIMACLLFTDGTFK